MNSKCLKGKLKARSKFTGKTVRNVYNLVSQRAKQNTNNPLGISDLFHSVKVVNYTQQDEWMNNDSFERLACWHHCLGFGIIAIIIITWRCHFSILQVILFKNKE